MFALNQHASCLINVNTRIERHGDQRKLACDAKFVTKIANDLLNAIEPGLCEAMYRSPRSGEQQALLDGPLTAVKFPAMKPLQLTHKFPGYEITIAPLGADEGEGLFLADVELKGFALEFHEGGSATVTFTASTEVDTDEASALLDALIDEDAQITLKPPSAQPVQDLGDSANDDDAGEETERCEGGEPDCGPVEFHDNDGVPLCKRCWDALDTVDNEDALDDAA